MDIAEFCDITTSDQRLLNVVHNCLFKQGWFHSLEGGPKSFTGDPLPWLTYPAIAMLQKIVSPEFRVFEYGCGNSTIWWDKNVKQVIGVDHNSQWVEKLRSQVSGKTTIVHRGMGSPVSEFAFQNTDEFFEKDYDLPTSGVMNHDIMHGLVTKGFLGYASEILKYPQGYFDIVVVDGMSRVLTAWLASRQVNKKGMIVFDNTDRWQYHSAYEILKDSGFARIDFFGIYPGIPYTGCTSFFVKDVNIFQNNVFVRGASDLGW